MELIQEKIDSLRNPLPPQPMRMFYIFDRAIIEFVSNGNLFFRMIKLLFVIGLMAIFPLSLTYLALDIIFRIFGAAFLGKPKIRKAFLQKLNEMYLKSLVEVGPYINQQVLQNIGSLPSTEPV